MDDQSDDHIESQQPKKKRQKTILHLWGEFMFSEPSSNTTN